MDDRYHFIGIGGIGMSGLARLLLSRQKIVTGSDLTFNFAIERLVRSGATIMKGHSRDHVVPGTTVVYGTDIGPENPEFQAALALRSPIIHRSDLLALLTEGKRSFAVAGTHGKTTVSSLLATVLFDSGSDPSFAVGGIVSSFSSNAYAGKGNDFILEADESDGSFLKYRPFGAIVTNVDNDHLISYGGSERLLADAFYKFIGQVGSLEHLFWSGDDPVLRKMNPPGNRYGFHPECDWRILSYKQSGFRSFLDIENKGKHFNDVEIALAGRHNASNATAVFACALGAGVEEESIRSSFKRFKGVHRRCETKGESNGVLLVDDYGHHPTEIRTTLNGIRLAMPDKRLVVSFQPHRYTRTRDCLDMFGNAFDDADEVILTDIYSAGEAPIPGITIERLTEEIKQISKAGCSYIPRQVLSIELRKVLRPGDLLVTLGAGDITLIGPEILEVLSGSNVGNE